MKSLKLAGVAVFAAGTMSAVAATVSVAEGDDLAAKVEEARSLAIAGDAEVVIAVAPGTYTLNGEIVIDYGMRLKGTGTREETIITQGAENQRVMVVTNGIVDTVTIRGGNYTENWVYVNPTKIDNHAGYTMVLKKSGQDTLMTNCVVIGANSSNRKTLGSPGGGLAVYDATVRDSLLMGGDAKYENSGVLYLSSGLIYDTEITGGHSTKNGGGVWMNGGGKMVNCLIHGNVCDGSGGGARVTCWSWQQFYNCTIVSNAAAKGAGMSFSEYCDAKNCIIWGNAATTEGEGEIFKDRTDHMPTFINCCSSEELTGTASCADNIVGDPLFADFANGDYRLTKNSPCIDKGYTKPDAEAMHDFVHRTRPIAGTAGGTAKYDLGCYEFDPALDAALVTFSIDKPVQAVGAAVVFAATFVSCGEAVEGATYEWDFGDGGTETGSATVTHAYATPGRYTVSVRATKGVLDEACAVESAVKVFPAGVAALYVNKTGSGEYPYDTPERATDDLLAAVDAANDAISGGFKPAVVIADGDYPVADEVSVRNGLVVRSLNGPSATTVRQLTESHRVFGVSNGTVAGLRIVGASFANNNIVTSLKNHYGYAVALDAGTSTLTNCVVTGVTMNGTSGDRFGTVSATGGAKIYRTTVCGNGPGFSRGAGVYLESSSLYDSVVTNNTGVSGGAVYVNASCNMHGCLIADNAVTAGTCAGFQCSVWSGTYLNYNTIANNRAVTTGTEYGCGVYASNGTWARMYNCIIWGNTVNGNEFDVTPHASMWFRGCCSPYEFKGENDEGNQTYDPLFADAASGDYRLSRSSPCIDTANSSYATHARDLNGRVRPIDGTGSGVAKYDVGCYEFDPALDAALLTAERTSSAVTVVGGEDSAFAASLVIGGAAVSGATYEWDFGDGGTDSGVDLKSANHAYATPGVYDVTVVARKGADCETAKLARTVTVLPAEPFARVYVSTSGRGEFPYDTEGGAAGSVPEAVHAVRSAMEIGRPAAEIVVGDGTYLLADEFLVDGGMRVVSANGPQVTRLVQTNANHRILVLHNEGLVAGFTLVGTNFTTTAVQSALHTTSGYAAYVGRDQDGGLAKCMVSNCWITGVSVTATSGSRHGALYMSNATLADCRVFGNGGNVTQGSGGYFSNANLTRCQFVSNVCISTGTVLSNSRTSMYNCLIADNVATESEPGYYCYNWSGSYIHNCTIAGNRSLGGTGAGLHIGQGGWTYFRNCVIAGNFVGETESNITRDTDVTFTRCCSPEALNGAKDAENIQAVPVFADAANGNYRLASSSPCIDAGRNSEAPAGSDLDGNERIVDGKHTGTPIVDIGCYEYAPSADETLVFISRTSAAETLVGTESAFAATVVKGGEDVDPADVSYVWSFGDGETESGVGKSAVTHGYAAGTYSVTLTVTVGGVEATAEMPNAVTAYGSSVAYVSNEGSDTWPYDEPGKATPSPETALTYVRKAVAAGFASGEVVLKDGDYEINQKMTLDFAVTMRSENGPEKTVIRPVDNKPITMVSVTGAKATLAGVTLADARNTSTFQAVALSMSNGLATNCVIRGIESGWSWNATPNGCALSMSGGLAVEMTITNNISPSHDYCQNASPVALSGTAVLDRAVIADNEAGRPVGAWITSSWNRKVALTGGGVYLNGANAVCRNSFITDNRTVDQPGAGAYVCAGTLENCTVSGNRMMSPTNTSWSAGVYAWPEAKVVNCIVDGNVNGTAVVNAGGEDETVLADAFTYCCLPGFARGGVGCLTDDPQLDGFVPNGDVVGGKGRKAPWMNTAKDLVGRRRLIGGKVDIGCYETDFTYGLMLLVK